MLSREDYIRLSLDLDLFFLRIMKEHSFFLKASFTTKNISLAETAGYFIRQFEGLLEEAVQLSSGAVDADALKSGQFFTQYTMDAERVSQYYTGILIDSSITRHEQDMQPGAPQGATIGLEGSVSDLNQRAMSAVTALASFKSKLLSDVLACRLFINMYPTMIDHILREAVFFSSLLLKLQNRIDARAGKDLLEKEAFWNRIMGEHARFARGLLDPSEVASFEKADTLGNEFDKLSEEVKLAQNNPELAPKATADSLTGAQSAREFDASGAGGALSCKVKSIMLPLLNDHVLRETNHYIYVLQKGS